MGEAKHSKKVRHVIPVVEAEISGRPLEDVQHGSYLGARDSPNCMKEIALRSSVYRSNTEHDIKNDSLSTNENTLEYHLALSRSKVF